MLESDSEIAKWLTLTQDLRRFMAEGIDNRRERMRLSFAWVAIEMGIKWEGESAVGGCFFVF